MPVVSKLASTFKRLVIWRSDSLFFGTRRLVKGFDRVGLGLGLGVGLGASRELSIGDCRYAIRGNRVTVPDTRP